MTFDHSVEGRSLPELLKLSVQAFPSQTAISFQGRTIDFKTFDHDSDCVAAFLCAKSIAKGDRVGLYCVNSDAYAIAYFGIVKAGATVVPLNLMLNPKEVEFILNDAGIRALVYDEVFAGAVDIFRSSIKTLDFCIRIGGDVTNEDDDWREVVNCDENLPAITFEPAEDVAVILYTSGTTGRPKGAMLTHQNLAYNARNTCQAMRINIGEDAMLVVLPMFHSFAATVGMLMPLLHGCRVIPLPKFEPETLVNTIARERATVFLGVPSMYSVLLRLPEEATAKLESLRFCVSGGAAMPVELMNQFESRYGVLIYEGDGPTECSPVTCVNPVDGLRKVGSVGLPIPSVEMVILDDRGVELAHGEVGEICVCGPNVMKGYWNLPEATKESFFAEWFRTGDLGYEDDDGYFFIVDRKKDMIIVNGMNVYPRMIEEVLYTHEQVREAAVVGEPNELHGEIPIAYIALQDNASVTVADIRAFCRQHLGRYEVPRKVVFMKELPKNATGKILKRELRKQGELERGIDSRQQKP